MNNSSIPCVMPWIAFNIETIEGDVYPCCRDWSLQSYGNVHTDSIKSIRNSKVAIQHRKAMLCGQIEDFCRKTCPKLQDGSAGIDKLRKITTSGTFTHNTVHALAELESGEMIVNSTPVLLQLLTTSYCNLRCVMCTQPHNNSGHLPPELYDEIEQILPGAFRITLLGGEVLADYWTRSYLLGLTKEKLGDTRIGLVTNGLLLDTVFHERLSQYCFDYIIVSVNAASVATYKRVHGRNAFTRVLQNLKLMMAEAPEIPWFASFVIQPENHRDLPGFVTLCKNVGVGMKFVPVVNESCSFSDESTSSLINSIQRALDNLGPGYDNEFRQLLHAGEVLTGKPICIEKGI